MARHPRGRRLHQDLDGQVQPAATLPVTLLMLEVVRDWHRTTGEKIGVKPAGGIRMKDAIKYLVTVAETVGEEWLQPHLFRYGASSLLNDVLMQRQKLAQRALLRRRLRDDRLGPDMSSEYAPAPESRAILNLRDEYGLFIDGEFRPGTGSRSRRSRPRTRSTSPRSRPRARRTSTPPSPPRAAPTTRRGRR